jgi:hypothetical protein
VVEPEEIGWTVSVEFASDTPSKLGDFEERVTSLASSVNRPPIRGAVTMAADHTRYGCTISVDGDRDAASAVAAGIEILKEHGRAVGLPPWPLVWIEVQTFAEHERSRAKAQPR